MRTLPLLLLLLAACATSRAPRLYDALGGARGIERLVDALSNEYHADPVLGPLFADADRDYFKARLGEQICAETLSTLSPSPLAVADTQSTVELDDSTIEITLKR